MSNNNTSNNVNNLSSLSWRSDQDDDTGSLNSAGDQQHQANNTSQNSGYSRNSSKGSRSRYNHYRRDPPTRVKPWMRDLNVTGSSSNTSGRTKTGRFGGPRAFLAEPSSSCNNSVSSQSSYRSRNSNSYNGGEVPREVTHAEQNISTVSQDEDDEEDSHAVVEEKREDQVTSEEPSAKEAKTPRVANITANNSEEVASSTFDTEEGEVSMTKEENMEVAEEKTEETVKEEIMEQPNHNEPEQEPEEPAGDNNPEEEQEEEIAPLEESPTDEVLAVDDTPKSPEPEDDEENPASEDMVEGTVEDNQDQKVTESAKENTPMDQIEESAEPAKDDDETENPTQTEQSSDAEKEEGEQRRELSKENKIDDKNHDEDETMPESDSTASSSERSRSYEVYDELPQVQPSSYNPMAAAMFKREEPPAASAFSALEKPTPLVASQGELLNDAIMEEESDEEEEGEEEEEEENAVEKQVVDAGQALDQLKDKSEPQDEDATDIFYNKWPSCIFENDLPTIQFPSDWERRQDHAVEVTKAWIRKGQETDGDAEVQSSSEEDKKEEAVSTDSYYCQFAAALKDCPALTTGFWAVSQKAQSTVKDGSNNIHDNICFCPCSVDMGRWRQCCLAEAAKDGSIDLFEDILKCSKAHFSPKELLQHCEEVAEDCNDSESRVFHAIMHKYLECLFGEQEGLAHLFEATLVGDGDVEEAAAREDMEIMNEIRQDIQRLEEANAELTKKLQLAEEKIKSYETKDTETVAYTREQAEKLKQISENLVKLQETNADLTEKLRHATAQEQEEVSKNVEAATKLQQQEEKLNKVTEAIKKLEQANADLVKKAKMAEERAKIEEARNVDAAASSRAQAEMMSGLCEEMKQLEEKNADIAENLRLAEEKGKELEDQASIVTSEKESANEKIVKLSDEISKLQKANSELTKKVKLAEINAVSPQSDGQARTLVHVGDMPVDVERFRIQFHKFFNHLRVAQLKSHCIRDKSPVKMTVQYSSKAAQSINIQALLDECAERDTQDTTYLFRNLDVFNKGHFHSHRLLIPWKISSKDGSNISRSEFFSQLWNQMGSLKVKVGDKKTEVPLFQEIKGVLIPLPNATFENMLKVTPAELDRIFTARVAPYYRSIGRMIVQCIGASTDDNNHHLIPISGHVMPVLLRHFLFRGVDPKDESYPIDDLIDHAFTTLMGMENMSREAAFEYFGIDPREYNDSGEAFRQVRYEIHEICIKERSLALKALEEGLTLNGLSDLSFCCGLVPIEAINEVLFSDSYTV